MTFVTCSAGCQKLFATPNQTDTVCPKCASMGVKPPATPKPIPIELSNRPCVTRGCKVIPRQGRKCCSRHMILLQAARNKVRREKKLIERMAV